MEAMVKDIRRRPELRGPLRGQRLRHGAAAASAAADEGNLDGVVLGGVARPGGDGAGERRAD